MSSVSPALFLSPFSLGLSLLPFLCRSFSAFLLTFLSLPMVRPRPPRTPVAQPSWGNSGKSWNPGPRARGTRSEARHLVPPPARRRFRKPGQTPESGTQAPAHPALPPYLFLAPSPASSLEKPSASSSLPSSRSPEEPPLGPAPHLIGPASGHAHQLGHTPVLIGPSHLQSAPSPSSRSIIHCSPGPLQTQGPL